MAKRILAAVLAVLMLCGVLASCNNGGSTTSTTSTASTASTSSKTESKVESKVEEKKEIEIGLPQNIYITDYDDNGMTNKLEEELNCEITFNVFASDGMGEKVQLMISAGQELPDVFVTTGLQGSQVYEYGSKGTFIDLKPYFDDPEATPYFHAIESEADKSSMIDATTYANGAIYGFAKWEPETWNLTPYRIYINTQWLENLGLEKPTTTDELYDTLVAFAKEDPNGNGQADEIAWTAHFTDDGDYGCNSITAIMNAFIFTRITMSSLSLSYDGKTVIAPWMTEEFREGLRWMNKLYKEGVLTGDTFTNDQTAYRALLNYEGLYDAYDAGTVKSLNVVGLCSAGSDGGNFPNGVENRNFAEFYMLKCPKGPTGETWSPYNQYSPDTVWYITEYCKDPDFAVKMGDIFYRYDYSMCTRYGVEEVDWTADKEFTEDVYNRYRKLVEDAGYEFTPTDAPYAMTIMINIWNTNTNHYWGNQSPRYASLWHSNHLGDLANAEKTEYTETYRSYTGNKNLEYNNPAHPDYILPDLHYTVDEQDKITNCQVALQGDTGYVMTSIAQFITGEMDIEAEWDAYLAQLETYGVATYLEASQAAYERTAQFASIK